MRLYIESSSDKSQTPKGKGGNDFINSVLSLGNKKVANVVFTGDKLRVYTDNGVHTIDLLSSDSNAEKLKD